MARGAVVNFNARLRWWFKPAVAALGFLATHGLLSPDRAISAAGWLAHRALAITLEAA